MQVAVPIDSGKKLQEDCKDLENQYKKDKLDLYEYKLKQTAVMQNIQDNINHMNKDLISTKRQVQILEKNQAMNYGRQQGSKQ